MSVLTVRLAGPLQSWGVGSRHTIRTTLPYPSKSGIVGLLAAACGIPRDGGPSETTDVTLAELTGLRLAVRADQPGELLVDYHTVSGASHAPTDPAQQRLPTADDGRLQAKDSTKITRRHYLSDAAFTAYLEGDADLLTKVAHAVRRPRFPLFLGRRSCPPSKPLFMGIEHQTGLDHALRTTAWQAAAHEVARHRRLGQSSVRLDTVIESPDGTDVLPDQPLASAPPFRHRYTERPIRHGHITLPLSPHDTVHDPFELLG
ncbi:type I-E CRISPR-associated protein Cas5/CasD [Streptomyces sp. WAC01526]|uniref:type I-E CRISPR-associated protein Cas5/CasD n=1 Tax=Streptomyces sp. WAC01526 TaxID=2588709 RepID=UPI001651B413|nr:type I-E CRISPR-associated protein Cas5/CasD [Streptomyces sp. WAC01526]